MSTARTRWTIADTELLPKPWDDKRYEIIDGELYVSTQPHAYHQLVGFVIGVAPMLPGFAVALQKLFADFPRE